jgi:hypothetical protein
MKPLPKIVASRGNYRLVHQAREASSWPNISDLDLERLETDAMGEAHWLTVTSWCLSERTGRDLRESGEAQVVAALKMLLDAGPIEKKE